MLLFRVLHDTNDKDILNTGISAKMHIPGSETVSSALKLVNSHVKNGSSDKTKTCWISVSKNFLRDVEEYDMPIRNFNATRHNIAIIDGYDSSELKFKTYYSEKNDVMDFLNQKLYGVDRIVLDFSSKDKAKELRDKGLHLTVNGNKMTHHSISVSFSTNVGEVLIYDNIPKENIRAVIKPLEIDILYSLVKEKGLDNNSVIGFIAILLDEIDEVLEKVKFTEQERILFDAFYNKRKHLFTVACEMLDENKFRSKIAKQSDHSFMELPTTEGDLVVFNNDDIDVLNVFAYLKRKKRVILEKIINELDFRLDKIAISEDVKSIVRVGAVNQPYVERLFYKGSQFFIPCQNYDVVEGEYQNFGNTSGAILYGPTDLKDNNLYWLTESDRIEKKHRIGGGSLKKDINDGKLNLVKR